MSNQEVAIEYIESRIRTPGFSEKVLRWAGIGCMLEVTSPDGVSISSAFSLDRLDKPKFYKEYNTPQVIRLNKDSDPDYIEDLVAYGHTVEDLPESVGTYRIPKVIDNMYEFSYGEWLRPDAVLTHNGAFYFSAIKLTIERGEGSEQHIADWSYKNMGAISLQEMGTAPFYPLMASSLRTEEL